MSIYSPVHFSNRISPYEDILIYSSTSNEIIVQNDGTINPKATQQEQFVGQTLYKTVQTVAEFFWNKYNMCGLNNEGKIPPFFIGCKEGDTGFSLSLHHHHEKFEFNNLDALQPEVVAHEYMHGVVSWLNPLNGSGQHGALDESLADVFAIVFKRLYCAKNDWNIGNYRDLSQSVNIKKELKGIDYENGEKYTEDNDYGHVHHNSRFLSHSFYLVRQAMGNFDSNYNILLGIWWKAFSELKDKSFNGFANKTVEVAYIEAGQPWGDAVQQSWQIVGLL